jgi:predicted N-formylglutamate amidohydrolase
MSEVAEYIPGDPASGLLLVADHASAHVPADIDLGIDPALLSQHIAVDIGIAPLSRDVAARLGCPAVLASVSRLVMDLHRRPHEPAAIPVASDGHAISGNCTLNHEQRLERIDRFWTPYHSFIDRTVEDLQPRMLFTLHSFTPRLAMRPEEERPWHAGVLYNNDDRAARIGIAALRRKGVPTGDNQPYSGRLLNATMDLHAETRGLPYLAIEIRQDLIEDADGVARWADLLAPIIAEVRDAL